MDLCNDVDLNKNCKNKACMLCNESESGFIEGTSTNCGHWSEQDIIKQSNFVEKNDFPIKMCIKQEAITVCDELELEVKSSGNQISENVDIKIQSEVLRDESRSITKIKNDVKTNESSSQSDYTIQEEDHKSSVVDHRIKREGGMTTSDILPINNKIPKIVLNKRECDNYIKTKFEIRHDSKNNIKIENSRVKIESDQNEMSSSNIKQKKKHKCSECGFLCCSKTSLKVHFTRHTGERPFHCTICDLSCATKQRLSRHLMTHEGKL